MQDLRKIAAERAAKPKDRPIGSSFMTEHQRAKKALVKQIEALDGSNIQLIAASTDEDSGEKKILRVAVSVRGILTGWAISKQHSLNFNSATSLLPLLHFAVPLSFGSRSASSAPAIQKSPRLCGFPCRP